MTELDESIFGAPADRGHPSRRQRRGGHRAPGRRRGLVTLVAVLAVLAIGAVFAFTVFKPLYDEWAAPKDYEGEGTGSVSVTVNPGDSGLVIGQTLEKAGVVKTASAFTEALASAKGDEIQPGTYTLHTQMKASSALSMMRGGGNRDVAKVTIREGLWKTEVYDALAKGTGVPRADYDKAEAAAVANPASLGLPAASKGNPEGWLFPATYTFDKGVSATDQLKKLVAQAQSKLTEANVPADKAQHVLMVASLVEAEARHAEDGPKVARVLENRMAMKPPMKLQLDSTSMYGVGQRTGKAFSTEQMRAAVNPYNTYAIDGWPAGPIGNPGLRAITSALNPPSGSWLYFVTVNPQSGETVFSTTYPEHQAQVAKLNAWCEANKGKC